MRAREVRVAAAIAAAALLFACGGPAPAPPEAAAPTPTDPPPTTPPAPVAATLVPVGQAETVFDWTSDRCDDEHIPDLPARAFRDADDQVHLISTHLDNRRFLGDSLDTVEPDCSVVMRSDHEPDPSRYDDNEWLAAPYTEDGRTVYALVHQEYHGWEHGDCPGRDHFACWFNSITLAVSTDGGESYQRSTTPPGHLVATLPHRYEAGAGPYGVFEPTNIIKGPDDHYYAFVRQDDFGSGSQRICLMRSDNLADARSWRTWDGDGFTVPVTDPYATARTPATTCAAIDPDHLGVMAGGVTYNDHLGQYVMVGATAIHIDGREVWGVLYSFSTDLIHWTPRQLLAEVELPWTYQPGDGDVYLYPSLLDPDSPSRNFETTGQTAYLYLTRFNSDGTHLDRDLIRVPVEFFLDGAAAERAAVPFPP